VFVLAVGELAHLIIDEPRVHMVFVTLGLFVALWWTWVGFTVLYNRHGAEDGPQRILFLAASAPVGVAAVAVGPASKGHITAFAVSLAATRVILALGHLHDDNPASSVDDELRMRTARAFGLSVVLFTASIWVPTPFCYIVWSLAYLHESRVMLTGEGRHGLRHGQKRAPATAPRLQSGMALDADHFAERFGLFIIILLGEVVVEAGEAAADATSHSFASWSGLVGALTLAAIFWWTYFAAAAEIDLDRLKLSGGSPALARAIFAAGHMIPAFALLLSAAGVGILLRHDPPRIGYWLACVGAGIYLGGTQSYGQTRHRWHHLLRTAVMAVTYALGTLHWVLSPASYIWVLAAVVATGTAIAAWTSVPASEREARPPAINPGCAPA
jgi:low temperature requirement protein LtrA